MACQIFSMRVVFDWFIDSPLPPGSPGTQKYTQKYKGQWSSESRWVALLVDFWGVNFRLKFRCNFASILAPKMIPKWIPNPSKICLFSHWALRVFFSGLELLLALVFASLAGVRTLIFHWKIQCFLRTFHFTTDRVANDIALLFRLPRARKNN